MATPKNLGPAAAIKYGETPPTNTKMLWFDENPVGSGGQVLKYFSPNTNQWEPLLNPFFVEDKHQIIGFSNLSTVNIVHSLNKITSVSVLDVTGKQVETEVRWDPGNSSLITILMNAPISGFVSLN